MFDFTSCQYFFCLIFQHGFRLPVHLEHIRQGLPAGNSSSCRAFPWCATKQVHRRACLVLSSARWDVLFAVVQKSIQQPSALAVLAFCTLLASNQPPYSDYTPSMHYSQVYIMHKMIVHIPVIVWCYFRDWYALQFGVYYNQIKETAPGAIRDRKYPATSLP